jgi:myo-inositol-1(or 4)-monophosphatase
MTVSLIHSSGSARKLTGLFVSALICRQSFGFSIVDKLANRCSFGGSARYASSSSVSAKYETWQDIPLDECQEILATAQVAARAAGEIILENLGCCSEMENQFEIKYSIKDVVTAYDMNAQSAIEDIVRAKYPKHSFLGEEDVDPGAAASEKALISALGASPSGFIWICDPIDGTANFASGLPLCAVTMGVVYKSVPIAAIVYDPHLDEMFSVIRGQGAYLNGNKERLQVQSAVTSASDAIINAGCPADPSAFEASMRGMLALNSKARGVRVIACSALTLSWIAAGRLTAHFGYDLSSWDLVAGALLIQEAGGRITDLDGSDYKLETRNMLCSNTHVHDEVLGILREGDAVSFARSK